MTDKCACAIQKMTTLGNGLYSSNSDASEWLNKLKSQRTGRYSLE